MHAPRRVMIEDCYRIFIWMDACRADLHENVICAAEVGNVKYFAKEQLGAMLKSIDIPISRRRGDSLV